MKFHPLLKSELTKIELLQMGVDLIKGERRKRAFILHALHCHRNHTDECGWYYEIDKVTHDWSGPAHQKWLDSTD